MGTVISTYDFDSDTRVEPVGDGIFRATLTDRWDTFNGPDGGYVMAVAGQAAAAVLDHPHPFTVSTHFVRSASAGPVEIVAEKVRSGRRHSTAEVTMSQDGKPVLKMLATFGDLQNGQGPAGPAEEPPAIPGPGECVDPWAHTPAEMWIPMGHRIEARVPELPGWMRGEPSGRPMFEYHQRFRDGREADPISLLFFADSAPPAVFELGHMASITLEMSVHVRAIPAPGWLTFVKTGTHVKDGYFTEDVTMWDSGGSVVAASRQLGLII